MQACSKKGTQKACTIETSQTKDPTMIQMMTMYRSICKPLCLSKGAEDTHDSLCETELSAEHCMGISDGPGNDYLTAEHDVIQSIPNI